MTLLTLTYLVYVLFCVGLVFGGLGYAVFILGYSGWWMLVCATLRVYSPKEWGEMAGVTQCPSCHALDAMGVKDD